LTVSTASTLAIHAMAYLAASGVRAPVPAATIGFALDVSPSHLSKVLQGLARSGLISSVRGAKGGFALKIDPDEVSLLQVVQAVSGPVMSDSCLLGPRICKPGRCKLAAVTSRVSALINKELQGMTLAQFADSDSKRGGRGRGASPRSRRKPAGRGNK